MILFQFLCTSKSVLQLAAEDAPIEGMGGNRVVRLIRPIKGSFAGIIGRAAVLILQWASESKAPQTTRLSLSSLLRINIYQIEIQKVACKWCRQPSLLPRLERTPDFTIWFEAAVKFAYYAGVSRSLINTDTRYAWAILANFISFSGELREAAQ